MFSLLKVVIPCAAISINLELSCLRRDSEQSLFQQVYFQELCGSEPELKLPCSGSPIIDPHLSPDGSMLAYVRDDELHVLSLSPGEPKLPNQLTFGARANGKVRYSLLVITMYPFLMTMFFFFF